MAVSCTPNDLAAAAKCFECLDEKTLQGVQTYLLAVIAGGSTDPNTLVRAAKDFIGMSPLQLAEIQNYLLCQIANQ